MPGRILAAARTPWAPRHTALEGARPEALLAAAIAGAADRAQVDGHEVDRVLVACDTAVGAQALDLARRAAVSLGWAAVPGLTVDGQGVTGLALIDLAVALPGVTVVAGVDVSSMVPPGAGLVRDYGRPTVDEPEHQWLERLAQERGLDRAALDQVVAHAASTPVPRSTAILPDAVPGVDEDTRRSIQPDESAPLTDLGLLTTDHLAPWADGAVAIVVGHRADGRDVTATSVTAGTDADAVDWLTVGTHTIAADHTAVIGALGGTWAVPVASPLAVGSTPSCDGLRVQADMVAMVRTGAEVRTRGRHGQMASVTLAPDTPDPGDGGPTP